MLSFWIRRIPSFCSLIKLWSASCIVVLKSCGPIRICQIRLVACYKHYLCKLVTNTDDWVILCKLKESVDSQKPNNLWDMKYLLKQGAGAGAYWIF